MGLFNPAFDYDNKEHNYASIRKEDPRIYKYIDDALAGMHTVINVGAGTGSYEPQKTYVISIEPSMNMRQKRIELNRTPAIRTDAENLPFDDKAFDAGLTVLTIHHWPDLVKGLLEIKRVVRKKLLILTYDPDQLNIFWNSEYFPEVVEVEKKRYPKIATIVKIIKCNYKITNIKIPLDCIDGIQEAFYGRPEKFLLEEVRQSQSAWGFISKEKEEEYISNFEKELKSGDWDRKYGFYRSLPEFEGAYRMIEFDLTTGST